ncbi:MAG: kynureninase [Candidatus Kapaibacterium sp.]
MTETTTTHQRSLDYARELDRNDPLAEYRNEYYIPKGKDGNDLIYFTGNSLGLQPKSTFRMVEQELKDWQTYAVEGHFDATYPWFSYHEMFAEPESRIVGGTPEEVVVMNTLTTNLHLMMVSFYRPTKDRFKIVIEENAFPSDRYAVASQARFHGYDPAETVVELKPREGENTLRTEDIEEYLEREGESVALVMMGGVNYYTGQAFEMEKIAAAGHAKGCVVGFDLAHCAGNLLLNLHDWNVDFAVWCTYKYLNSGPGGVSGCFVHERHAFNPDLPRFAGWWGNDPATRFEMPREFVPQRGAAGWQLSNAQILPMAAHWAALQLFDRAGMKNLRAKSEKLTGYLEYLLSEREGFQILTPADPTQRGCQLSIRIGDDAKSMVGKLMEHGIVADYRVPDVIRVAPVPMYNSFEDVWRFVEELGEMVAG